MSTPAWISALPTGVVKTDLTADAADGVLTYTEALQLLNDVQAAGAVTATEFSSLQSAAANLNNGLATSAYVASIFTQLVDGSPANANWTAGGAAASATPLGDLAAGSTQTHLAQLVGQWFLGTNLPDPAPPSGPTYSYSTVTAPLYGSSGAANVNDICQGADGDCEVMTGLILLVDNHRQQLAQMIVANPNGTWGVRFYVNGNEVWETVNDQFPTQGGELVYAHDPNFANTALWTAVIEKAYAQLSATGEIGHPAGVDSYDNINANAAADIMPAMIDAANVTYFKYNDANFTADKIFYIDAVASGDDLMVETGANAADTHDASGNIELVGDHAFAVTGYDAATGDFIVRNPWGNSFTGQNWDTTFEVSLSAIAGVDGDLAIDNTGHGGSAMTLFDQGGEILSAVATPITGLVRVIDATGAAPQRYNLQVVGGGALQLNGATNIATAAQTALGQVVVSASQLSKVTILAGSGKQDLLVSVYDGKAWSAFADEQLTVSTVGATYNAALDPVVAAGGTIAVTSLVKLSGTTFVEIDVPTGDGVVNLNGATNDWTGAQPSGQTIYDVSTSQLSLLTYTAPTTGGAVTLSGTGYSGTGWTPWQNIRVGVGIGVGAALTDYANGQLGAAAAVVDTAANIFANLNALQTALTGGELTALEASNTALQHESLGQAHFMADAGVLSMLQGDVAVTEIPASYNLLGAGLSDFLIESTAGAVDAVQIGAGNQNAYKLLADMPTGWSLAGAGDFLGDGRDQFLVATTSGEVLVGDMTSGKAAYTQIATLAAGTTLIGSGAFLGALGADRMPNADIMIENAAGTVFVGAIGSNHKGTYTSIGAFGTGWKLIGTGDFLAAGHDQFLIGTPADTLLIGNVVSGKVAYTNIATLAAGAGIVGVGAFLGTPGAGDLPKDDFLLENASGALFVGEVGAANKVTYTDIATLAAGWHVVGTGDFLDEGHDQFLVETASDALFIGDYSGGATHFTLVADLAAQWSVHG